MILGKVFLQILNRLCQKRYWASLSSFSYDNYVRLCAVHGNIANLQRQKLIDAHRQSNTEEAEACNHENQWRFFGLAWIKACQQPTCWARSLSFLEFFHSAHLRLQEHWNDDMSLSVWDFRKAAQGGQSHIAGCRATVTDFFHPNNPLLNVFLAKAISIQRFGRYAFYRSEELCIKRHGNMVVS